MHREEMVKIPELIIFPWNGHHVVFNVSTSALYEIDQKAASVLNQLIQGSRPENSLGNNEILKQLQMAGMFSSLPPPKKEANPPLTSLYLMVSSQCNLRCLYCFDRGKRDSGETKSMSKEVGERAVDFLLRESRDESRVKIVFFGGEPLLNSDLLTHLIYYGQQKSSVQDKEIRFVLITNGTLFSPKMIDLLSQGRVSIQISLDGPPQVQNRLRPTAEGGETYEQVIHSIRKLQKGGVQRIGLHATIFSLKPSPVEILEHLWSLGVGPIAMAYVHPTQDRRHIWSQADIPVIKKVQEELAEYFLHCLHEGRLFPCMNLLKFLLRLNRRQRFIYHCGCGTRMGAVTAEGTVFPCARFAEEPVLAIGDVFTGLNRRKLHPYIQYTVDKRELCQNCWARYLCGGGCSYNNLLVNGDITRPDPYECAQRKYEIQAVIQLYARIKRESPELVEKIEREGLFSFSMCGGK